MGWQRYVVDLYSCLMKREGFRVILPNTKGLGFLQGWRGSGSFEEI